MRWRMPPKIREIKAALRRAGFRERPGEGSHTVWSHPLLKDRLTLSGADGNDAKRYQERDVQTLVAKARAARSD